MFDDHEIIIQVDDNSFTHVYLFNRINNFDLNHYKIITHFIQFMAINHTILFKQKLPETMCDHRSKRITLHLGTNIVSDRERAREGEMRKEKNNVERANTKV